MRPPSRRSLACRPRRTDAVIRIAINREAFDAICATLPLGSGAYEPEANAKGERLIRIERPWTAQAAAR